MAVLSRKIKFFCEIFHGRLTSKSYSAAKFYISRQNITDIYYFAAKKKKKKKNAAELIPKFIPL